MLNCNYEKEWRNACAVIKKSLGKDVYLNWIMAMHFVSCDGNTIVFAVKNKFICHWIQQNYLTKILSILSNYGLDIKTIELQIDSNINGKIAANNHNISDQDNCYKEEKIDQYILSSQVDTNLTFDKFVVDETNKLAFLTAQEILNNKISKFNPLFIHGKVGIGKTHLLNAIANLAKASNINFAYLSIEKFMYDFVSHIKQNNVFLFKDKLRAVDILLIDDLHFITGKKGTQEEFLHTFNFLISNNAKIVMAADKLPSEINNIDDKLRSRISSGFVVDIKSPGFDLRLQILISKAENMKLSIPKDVLVFLADNINTSIRELEGALMRLAIYNQLEKIVINVDLAKQILSDLFHKRKNKISVANIKQSVAEYFSIDVQDLESSQRARDIVRPRQIAMFVCKKITQLSLVDIGAEFGGKDHAIVIYSINNIAKMIKKDSIINSHVNNIIDKITLA